MNAPTFDLCPSTVFDSDTRAAFARGYPETPHKLRHGLGSHPLLELDALAAPERSVELRRRSEEREDDPFDLPPE